MICTRRLFTIAYEIIALPGRDGESENKIKNDLERAQAMPLKH
jgi:hypothetical protein